MAFMEIPSKSNQDKCEIQTDHKEISSLCPQIIEANGLLENQSCTCGLRKWSMDTWSPFCIRSSFDFRVCGFVGVIGVH